MEEKNKQILCSTSFWVHFEYWALLCLFVIGILLSIVSVLNLCTLECSETKSYLLFGFPFAYMGLAFFSIAIISHICSSIYPLLRLVLIVLVVGSLGAESMFIWIQKYRIGSWCPVCLSIAAVLAIAAVILCLGSIIRFQQLGKHMNITKKILGFLPVFLIGLLAAFIGISKPDQNLLAMNSMKEKIELGNTSSPIEVYFVSDWFCPACKKVEPIIKRVAPKIMKHAGFFFIDLAVHPETANYSPYNIDFLVYNKANYLEIRDALIQLASVNRSPDDTAINRAIASTGQDLKELGYGDIKAGLRFFDEIATKYDVKSTPTLIIVNTKTNKVRILKGGNEITESNVLNTISNL